MTALAVISVLLVVGALFFVSVITRRARQLYAALEKLLDDAVNDHIQTIQYDESITSALSDKLRRYIQANQDRLTRLSAERKAIETLVSDISHQSATPITNILLYSELLLEHNHLPDDAIMQVKNLYAQGEQLAFLLDALVKMSRLETGILTVEPTTQPLRPLLASAMAEIYPMACEKQLSLSLSLSGDITATFDAKWTREALHNVMENAVKYSTAGGSIVVAVTVHELFVQIDVTDQGVGICEEEYTEIFKRFYRSPRTRGEKGVGVGLYLAREILMLQGGYMQVHSKIGNGSVFSMFLRSGKL